MARVRSYLYHLTQIKLAIEIAADIRNCGFAFKVKADALKAFAIFRYNACCKYTGEWKAEVSFSLTTKKSQYSYLW